MSTPKKKILRRFFKAIALMTAVCLAVPSSTFASPAPSAALPTLTLQNQNAFTIPNSLGTLDEFKPGRIGKTFILIQDAHQSFEAQQNIAKLINVLVEEHGVKTVFEEGYEGPVPTDELMKDVSDSLVKQRVSYYLMDQLQIGGAEYAHINRKLEVGSSKLEEKNNLLQTIKPNTISPKEDNVAFLPTSNFQLPTQTDFKLIGADKLREHFDSVAWYSKASRVQAQVDRDLSSANKELERLIPRFVSKPMRRLLKAKRAYEIQKIDFIAYLREIAGLAIDQTGGVSFSVDYPGLANAVRALDSKQAQAIEDVRKLAARDLWRELEQLEEELQQRFLKTDIEKSIIAFYDKINLLKRLNKIELTASEYERIKSTISGLHTQQLADFIAQNGKSTVVLSREWEDKIRYALEFYETALERDSAVRGAAEDFIKNPDEQTAVLVYGGFHTGRIRETLQSLGVSYAIVSPRITRADKTHEDRYRKLMSGSQQDLKVESANRLSRPLSAIELRMKGSLEVRTTVAAQVLALQEVMRSLPTTFSLPRAVREAELKLKMRTPEVFPVVGGSRSEVRTMPYTERWEAAKQQTYYAWLDDVDGNLTPLGSHEVSVEIISEYIHDLQAGLVKGIVTGRMEELPAEIVSRGGLDVNSAVRQIQDGLLAAGRPEAIRNLYLFPENASYVYHLEWDAASMHFVRAEEDLVARYHPEVLSRMTADTVIELYAVWREHLVQNGYADEPFLAVEVKRYGFGGKFLRADDHEQIEALSLKFQTENVQYEHFGFTFTNTGKDFQLKQVSKFLAVRYLSETLGLEENQIAAFGDRGGLLGNDRGLVNRQGGFSTDEFDPDNPDVVPLSHVFEETIPLARRLLARKELKLKSLKEGRLTKINKEESARILSNTEIHGGDYDGRILDQTEIRDLGMQPRHKMLLNGRWFYFPAQVYDFDSGRLGVLVYVELKPGDKKYSQEGQYVTRAFYRSHSHGGLWRYLPFVFAAGPNLGWHGKGHDEDSIGVDYPILKALNQIRFEGGIRHIADPVRLNRLFAGTTWRPGGERDAAGVNHGYAETYVDVVQPQGHVANEDSHTVAHLPGRTPPEKVHFTQPLEAPHFDELIDEFKIETGIYSDGVPDRVRLEPVEGQPQKIMDLKLVSDSKRHELALPDGTQLVFEGEEEGVKTLKEIIFTKGESYTVSLQDLKPSFRLKDDGRSLDARQNEGEWSVQLSAQGEFIFDARLQLVRVITPENNVMRLDYGIVTARVFDSKNAKLQSVFITDKFGRSMMLSLQQKDSPMTEIGIKQSWERAGSLAAALYEYAEQTGGFGDWNDRRENYVGMWLYYHSRIDFIREFTEKFVANGKEILAKVDARREEYKRVQEDVRKENEQRYAQQWVGAKSPWADDMLAAVATVNLDRKWQRPALDKPWVPYPATPVLAPIQLREKVSSSAQVSFGNPQNSKKFELTDKGFLTIHIAEGYTIQIPFISMKKPRFGPILGSGEKAEIRFGNAGVALKHAQLSFELTPGPTDQQVTIKVYLQELEEADVTWIDDELVEPGLQYLLVKRTIDKPARSEVRSEAIPPAVASDAAKKAILQAVRQEKTGVAARIVTALPQLFNAEMAGGKNLTATQVLERLNADKRYAIRLDWKKGGLSLSLVEDDGFEIALEEQPATWIDIDRPLWTEPVLAKHPWRPLVAALIAGLRPDQQRIMSESVGFGPRLAALYASARSEVRSIDLETAYELQDSILGIDDDESADGGESVRAIKLKVQMLMRLFQQYDEVTRLVQTEGLGADDFWKGLMRWSLIAANRDLIAARLVTGRQGDEGLLEVWLKLLRRYQFDEKEVRAALEHARVDSFKETESSDGKFLKKFEPKSVPKRDAFLYGVWKMSPSEIDSLTGIDLKTLMARYSAWQTLFDQEARGAVVLRTRGFAELLKMPLTPKRYKRLRAAIAEERAEEQIALEMKAAGLETKSDFTAVRKNLYGYQLWKNAAPELADEKPKKLFPRTRPANYWKIANSFRGWLTQRGAMPAEPMMQIVHAYTYAAGEGFRKTGAISLFEMKGAAFNQRVSLLINPRFWENKEGKKRAIWIHAAGVNEDGRKIITLHLRPNGRPLGVAYWNAQAQEFEDLSGPIFNVIHAKQIHRQGLAWAQDPYETGSLVTNLKVKGTEKNSFAVRLFPGVVQSSISNVRFRAGETIRVTAEAFGEERRFTAYLPEITDSPKRKAEVQYRYYHDDTPEDRLVTPGAELGRRLDASWAQGAPNPIAVRVDREGQLRAGIFQSIRIPSNKNRQVYVVFERVVKEGKVIQQVSVYGQQPKSRKNSEVNYLLWRGQLASHGRRLVSGKSFEPKRILGKERYQLQAWLSWGLGYTAPPQAGPGLSQEEIAYLAAGLLREKALTLKELKVEFAKQNVTDAALEAVLQKMKQAKGFGGYRIADAGSGRYGLLFSLVVGKGNILHPFRSHYRISYPHDLEGAPVEAMFDGKKLLQLHLKDNNEIVFMKHQWDFDGNLIWSGASHPPAQFTSFTFSSYEVPKTRKTSVSTAEQRFRIPGLKGEVISGVLINGELRRVDWFAPGTQLHNVYKVTAGKKGAHEIKFDEDLTVQPVRYLETKKGSLSLEFMVRVVFGSGRSEVRAGKMPDEGLLRVLGFKSREAYIEQLPKYSPEEWVGFFGKKLERYPDWLPVARDYFDSYFSAKTMPEITEQISMRSIRVRLKSEPHEALAMLLGHAVVLTSRRSFMRVAVAFGMQATVKTTPLGLAAEFARKSLVARVPFNSNRVVVRNVELLRWLQEARDFSVPDIFGQLSLEQNAVEKDYSSERHFSWAKDLRGRWGLNAADRDQFEKSRGVYTLPVRWIHQRWYEVIGYTPEAGLSPSTAYLEQLAAAAEREAHAEILSNAPAWAGKWAREEADMRKSSDHPNFEFWLHIVQRNFVNEKIQNRLRSALRTLAQPLVTEATSYYRNILSLSPEDFEKLRQKAGDFLNVESFAPANPAAVQKKAVEHMRAERDEVTERITRLEKRLTALRSGIDFDGISGDASEIAILEQELDEEKEKQSRIERFFDHLLEATRTQIIAASPDIVVPPISARSEVRKVKAPENNGQALLAEMNHPTVTARAVLLDFNDLVTFSPEEIRETAIVMKRRFEVRFVIYNAEAASAQLLHFKKVLDFRNVDWTQSHGESAFQALGPQFKEGGVIGFSRGQQDLTGGFSIASRKKISRFKLSEKKPGTMAVALSFNPEDPRYRWGILREGDFYVVADSLASIAVSFLNQFVVAVSA